MAKYRKKPIVIEAFQMTAERMWNNVDWPEWLHAAWNKRCDEEGNLWRDYAGVEGTYLHIVTLEGVLTVSDGDWIIKGVKDELYPCKPDIFEATYEEVSE